MPLIPKQTTILLAKEGFDAGVFVEDIKCTLECLTIHFLPSESFLFILGISSYFKNVIFFLNYNVVKSVLAEVEHLEERAVDKLTFSS